MCIHHLHPTALALAAPWDAGDPPLPYASPSQAGVGHVVSFERLAARRGRRVASERDKSMRMHPSQQRFRSGAPPAYVLHPYTLVKDTRTKYEDRDVHGVLDGKIDGFITAYLSHVAADV